MQVLLYCGPSQSVHTSNALRFRAAWGKGKGKTARAPKEKKPKPRKLSPFSESEDEVENLW